MIFGPFFETRFSQLLIQFRDHFLILFQSLFALESDLGEAAFLKDLPSEILVLVRPSVHETLRRGVPKGVQKLAPKKARKNIFGGLRFGSLGNLLGGSLCSFRPLSCCLAASWLKGPRKGGPKGAKERPRHPQETPQSRLTETKRGQESTERALAEPKRGPREAKIVPESPKIGPREPQRASKQPKRGKSP